ncbi:MAG: universal stress protein [Nitrososphaerota archaeon]|nr:universal stress protein [Nitrososphaerota archaeon]
MPKTASKVFGRILLATDGSPGAEMASEVAAQVARGLGSEVTVLCAIPSISALAAPLEGEYYSRLIDKADDAAGKAVAAFKRAGVAVAAKEVPQGKASPVQTILDYVEEEKTTLVVMGTRGLGGIKRAVLGSVSSAVTAHAPCASMVVRSDKKGAPQIKLILAAVDGSANSQRALEAAVELAKGVKASLRVAHVVYIPTLFWSMGIPGSSIPYQRVEDDEAAAGNKVVTQAVKFAKDAGVEDVEEELVTELVSPAQGLVQLAKSDHADLIVIGTRGNEGFKKLMMGSVANSVLHYADCSVLVVK